MRGTIKTDKISKSLSHPSPQDKQSSSLDRAKTTNQLTSSKIPKHTTGIQQVCTLILYQHHPSYLSSGQYRLTTPKLMMPAPQSSAPHTTKYVQTPFHSLHIQVDRSTFLKARIKQSRTKQDNAEQPKPLGYGTKSP